MFFYAVKKRVIVNTKTGRAFIGVLWMRRWGYLVLKNAQMLHQQSGTTPVDGEIVIDAFNVDFIQVVD
jgi:small nuclear ribonucleoprotein (snRNP)-like protein